MTTILQPPPRVTGEGRDGDYSGDLRSIIDWMWRLYEAVRPVFGQIETLEQGLQLVALRTDRLEQVMNGIYELQRLTQAISNPPTQAEVQAIQNKTNEILEAAQLPDIVSSSEGGS